MQQVRRCDVHRQANAADRQHPTAGNLNRIAAETVDEASDGGPADPGCNHPQHEGISGRCEHLGSLKAERALHGGGALRSPRGQQGQTDGSRVGECVTGVGQQGQASREDGAHHLGRNNDDGQRKRSLEPSTGHFPQVVVMLVCDAIQPMTGTLKLLARPESARRPQRAASQSAQRPKRSRLWCSGTNPASLAAAASEASMRASVSLSSSTSVIAPHATQIR